MNEDNREEVDEVQHREKVDLGSLPLITIEFYVLNV
jgi:hypothetical protein